MIYLIYDDNAYHLYSDTVYQLGPSSGSDIFLPLLEDITLSVEGSGVVLLEKSYSTGKHCVALSDEVTVTLLIFEAVTKYLLSDSSLYISGEATAALQLLDYPSELVLTLDSDSASCYSPVPYYLNGKWTKGKQPLKASDELVFSDGLVLSFQDQLLSVQSLYAIQTALLPLTEAVAEDRASEFHRSPRIILREPEGKVTIASVPTDDEGKRQSLLKLIITPLAMIVFTGLSYVFFRGGGMLMMMMGMSVITIGSSIHSYFSDKKWHKEAQQQKIKDYLAYLDTKYVELAGYREEQIEALLYHYPNMTTILEMAQKTDRRIYEKAPYHFDFLTYRLGLGDTPASFHIDYSDSELTKHHEKAKQRVQELIAYYQVTAQVPIQNAIASPIGYIGARKVVIEQVQQLMMQIATFQSYHDVQFIPIFREEELPLWNWSRWLPHTKLKALNSRGFVYSQRTRD